MTSAGPHRDALARATERRDAHAQHLEALVPELHAACAAMADRFRDQALLQSVGVGVSGIDAAHVTVEFLHPVTVGKRALPAVTLDAAHVEDVFPDAIALGLRLGDDARTRRALSAAHARGCLAVDLTSSGAGAPIDHVLAIGTDDVMVARELQVTAYHLLWEIVHEYLDAVAPPAPATSEDASDLDALYPFLSDDATPGTIDTTASTRDKIREVAALRASVLGAHADRLAAAAAHVARAGTVWTFGNGGSSTDAAALAHLLRDRDAPGRPHRARALSDDVATITALANDVDFDVVFARMLRSLARPGDVAVGFSTSGRSANVAEGLVAAHEQGCTTIAFAGYDGGDLADLDGLDHLFVVPSSSVHRIQEAQTTLAHVVVELARAEPS